MERWNKIAVVLLVSLIVGVSISLAWTLRDIKNQVELMLGEETAQSEKNERILMRLEDLFRTEVDSAEEHRRRNEEVHAILADHIRCLKKTHNRSLKAYDRCVRGQPMFETTPRPTRPRSSPSPSTSPSEPPGPSPEPSPSPSPSPSCPPVPRCLP